MDKANWKKRTGVTPIKLVLVGVLAVVLLVVIVVQLNGSTTCSDGPPRTPKQKAAQAARRTSGTASARQVDKKKVAAHEKAWPRIPLEQIVDHNPLAAPAWLAPPEKAVPRVAEPSQSKLDAQSERLAAWQQLQGQGVGVVLITPEGPVATIGDRLVRVGDFVDGFRVQKIDSQGLLLADPN